jgi:hypothetical protein
MRTHWIALGLVCALMIALAACGGGSAAPATTAPAAQATSSDSGSSAAPQSATSSASDTAEPTQPDQPAASGGDDTFQADKVTEGLAALDSYRATFRMNFEGSDDGTPTQWTFEMRMERTTDPEASRVAYLGSGDEDMGQLSGFEMVQVGDMQYVKFGEGSGNCITTPRDEDSGNVDELFDLDDVMGGLSNARRSGPDQTINGVRARHYTFDEGGLFGSTLGMTNAHGDVWVANDGDWVVKYELSAEGKDTLFGKAESEGKLTWTYEVTEVNARFEIAAPADCESAASDVPVMPDATEKSSMGSLITYKSASTFQEVLDFYQDEMPANGWEPSAGEPLLTGELAMLAYEKEGQKASITITVDSGQVSVMISVEDTSGF